MKMGKFGQELLPRKWIMEISTLGSLTKKGRNQGKVFYTAKMEIDILVIGN